LRGVEGNERQKGEEKESLLGQGGQRTKGTEAKTRLRQKKLEGERKKVSEGATSA